MVLIVGILYIIKLKKRVYILDDSIGFKWMKFYNIRNVIIKSNNLRLKKYIRI